MNEFELFLQEIKNLVIKFSEFNDPVTCICLGEIIAFVDRFGYLTGIYFYDKEVLISDTIKSLDNLLNYQRDVDRVLAHAPALLDRIEAILKSSKENYSIKIIEYAHIVQSLIDSGIDINLDNRYIWLLDPSSNTPEYYSYRRHTEISKNLVNLGLETGWKPLSKIREESMETGIIRSKF
jgi:hypothetical protein